MSTPTSLSALDVRAVITTYRELLHAHRNVINRLNVYPVPDGDTGTNMALTMDSVYSALEPLRPEATLGEVARAVAHGSLMGARGNSGVILSQLLRGLVGAFPERGNVDAPALATALGRADELARQAVARPVEGTILSVARAGARGALDHDDSLAALARGARDAAADALAHTPEQLPALRRAGVVDSGGSGLLLLFCALCFVVTGDAVPEVPPIESIVVRDGAPDDDETVTNDLRYEVMYLLDADDAKMHAFRDVWTGLGDSIVIVGGDGLYNCHIHTDDVGAAIEAALDAGRPREIRVTDLNDQIIEERWVRDASSAPWSEDSPAPTTAVIAVVVGDGVGRIFRSLGVRQLVLGGQSMNPSTGDLVAAVRASGSRQVVLLPNNKNVVAAALQVPALVDQTVRVVATTSIVGGFSALLAYDPDAEADENAEAMTASAQNVVAGEVTQAVRGAETEVGTVREGEWIGLHDSTVLAVSDSVSGAANRLLAVLVRPEHELVTIIEGDGSTPAATGRVREFLAEEYPHVTVEVHHGGQPLYPYLFGIE